MQDLRKPIEIFCSYAHADEPWRQQLDIHLSLMHRQGLISTWYNRQITAGTEWAQAIDTHLNSASVILLLISPDFFASDYCYGIEMQRALEQQRAGRARVIPILLRSVDRQGAAFAHLKELPTNAEPITTWNNQDEAFTDVATGIRQVIEDLTLCDAILAKLGVGESKDPNTVPAIINCLQIEPDPTTRYWLAYALGLIGGELALNALLDAKAREGNPFAQKGIEAGLDRFTTKERLTYRYTRR